jgi:hypothetical protein
MALTAFGQNEIIIKLLEEQNKLLQQLILAVEGKASSTTE